MIIYSYLRFPSDSHHTSASALLGVFHAPCSRIHRRSVHKPSSILPYRPADRKAMASQPKPTRKRDKIKSFLRNITPHSQASTSNIAATQPHPRPIPPQSSSDNAAPTAPSAPAIPPPPVAPQKAFVKTKVLEKDIAVLSITYVLADNPELKRLIHLIVGIHDKDEDDQVIPSIL
jgi:hypothetical protein